MNATGTCNKIVWRERVQRAMATVDKRSSKVGTATPMEINKHSKCEFSLGTNKEIGEQVQEVRATPNETTLNTIFERLLIARVIVFVCMCVYEYVYMCNAHCACI